MYRIISAGIFACASSLFLTASTEPGILWETANIERDRMGLNDIASDGGSRLVTVGEAGTIRVSDDQGENWSNRDSNVGFDLNGITRSNGSWIAVGGHFLDTCIVLQSPDGENWATTCLCGRPVLNGVGASPSTTVAVGDLELTARSSTNIEWMTETDSTRWFTDVVWSGSQFVAVGGFGLVKTSPDGVTWTRRSSGLTTDMTLNSVAWDGSTLVAAGYDFNAGAYSSLILTSTDGITWTAPSMAGIPDSIFLKKITWTGSRFVTMGSLGHTLTSPDGTLWSHHQAPGNIYVRSLCWDGHRLIAVGSGGAVLYSEFAAPDEAADWTVSSYSDNTKSLNDLTTGEVASTPRTVAVGDNGTVLSSDNEFDHITKQVTGLGNDLNGITTTTLPSSRFIAVGSSGAIATSPDAVTWTPRTSGSTRTLRAVDWFKPLGIGSSRAIAVGDSGTILTSTNTATWTSQTSATSNHLLDVTAGSVIVKPSSTQRIVAVGRSGTILYSSDGLSWSAVADSGTSEHLYAVEAKTFGFVAVGNHGVVLTSANGITWTKEEDISTETLYDLSWTGSQLVAVGDDGIIFTSPTGTEWTRRYGPGSAILNAVATLDSGRLAAVGVSERIITSDPSGDFPDWIAMEFPPPGEDDPEDDPNGDGITNLMAYGLDIPAADSPTLDEFNKLPLIVQPGMGRPLIVRLEPSSSALGDLAYMIDVSTTLRPDTWTEVLRHMPGQLCGTGSIEVMLSGSSSTVFLVFPESIGDQKGYFTRLRVEQVP